MRPPEKPFMVTLPRSGGPCVICGDAVHLSYFFGTEEKGDGWTHEMRGRRKLHDHAAQPPLASVSHAEQFVIQSRRAGSDDDWGDDWSLGWFAKTGRQAEALDVFREDHEDDKPQREFRMVRRTEEVLAL